MSGPLVAIEPFYRASRIYFWRATRKRNATKNFLKMNGGVTNFEAGVATRSVTSGRAVVEPVVAIPDRATTCVDIERGALSALQHPLSEETNGSPLRRTEENSTTTPDPWGNYVLSYMSPGFPGQNVHAKYACHSIDRADAASGETTSQRPRSCDIHWPRWIPTIPQPDRFATQQLWSEMSWAENAKYQCALKSSGGHLVEVRGRSYSWDDPLHLDRVNFLIATATPLASWGSLDTLLSRLARETGRFSPDRFACLVGQVGHQLLIALESLANQGLAHLDVKLSNIFVTEYDPSSNRIKVQLGDFGCMMEFSSSSNSTVFGGTEGYTFTYDRHLEENDAFGLGTTIFSIFYLISSAAQFVVLANHHHHPWLPGVSVWENLASDLVRRHLRVSDIRQLMKDHGCTANLSPVCV